MDWADCGTDSKGRSIGHAFSGVCDHPGCLTVVDRGLSHACGGMHGADRYSCEGYFCRKHLVSVEKIDGGRFELCFECLERIKSTGDHRVSDNILLQGGS